MMERKIVHVTWFQQFWLMIQKNILLKRRKPMRTAVEFLLPIVLSILVGVSGWLIVRSGLVAVPGEDNPLISELPPLQTTTTWSQYCASRSAFDRCLLGIVPRNDNTTALATSILERLGSPPELGVIYFSTTRDAERFYKDNDERLWAALDFTHYNFNLSSSTAEQSPTTSRRVIIRMDATFLPTKFSSSSNIWGNLFELLQIGTGNNFADSGFVHLQAAVLESLNPDTFTNFTQTIQYQSFPWKKARIVMPILYTGFPNYFILASIPLLILPLIEMVTEKTQKLRHLMKLSGLRSSVYWASWVVSISVPTVFGITVMLASMFIAKVVVVSNGFLVFLLFYLYGASLVTFCLCASAFCRSTKMAIAVGVMWTYGASTMSILALSTSKVARYFVTLIAPLAFAVGVIEISQKEVEGEGIHWDNYASNDPLFPFQSALVMLLVDNVLYVVLTWYFSYLFDVDGDRDSAGRALPWYFPLMPSFWCGERRRRRAEPVRPLDDAVDLTEKGKVVNEDVAAAGEVNVSVRHLTKVFAGDNVAVNDVSFDLYRGQIFALLGRNGAGKSTTISMLTGLIPPTSGHATVCGFDVTNPVEREALKARIGMCPQDNVLFDDLTPIEHLLLFSALKGACSPKVFSGLRDVRAATNLTPVPAVAGLAGDPLEAAKALLRRVHLTELRWNEMSRHLSGGMKRKLQLAIALAGDPEVVFLDEPSTGVDPASRRRMWELLQRLKGAATVVLTTHMMEEADMLADRVAIMVCGELKCVGSPNFLKTTYGDGYYLHIAKKGRRTDSGDILEFVRQSLGPGVDTSAVEIVGETQTDISILLPFSAVDRFPTLLAAIEQHIAANQLSAGDSPRSDSSDSGSEGATGSASEKGNFSNVAIDSYGISMTTLEDVFLKVSDKSPGIEPAAAAPSVPNTPLPESEKSHGAATPLVRRGPRVPSFGRQCALLLRQKRWMLWRRWSNLLYMALLPAALILLNRAVAVNIGLDIEYSHGVADVSGAALVGYRSGRMVVRLPATVATDTADGRAFASAVLGNITVIDDDGDKAHVDVVQKPSQKTLREFLLDRTKDYKAAVAITAANYTMGSQNSTNGVAYIALYRPANPEALPITVTMMATALANTVAGFNRSQTAESESPYVDIASEPFPRPPHSQYESTGDHFQQTFEKQLKNSDALNLAMILAFALAIAAVLSAKKVVEDVESKMKFQMDLLAIRRSAYWVTTILFEFVLMLISLAVVIIIVVPWQELSQTTSLVMVLILLIFVIDVLLFGFVLTYTASKATSMTVTMIVVDLGSVFMYQTSQMLQLIDSEILAEIIKYAIHILPMTSATAGLFDLFQWEDDTSAFELWSWDHQVSRCVAFMPMHIIFFILAIIFAERSTDKAVRVPETLPIIRPWGPAASVTIATKEGDIEAGKDEDEDEDVKQERKRIEDAYNAQKEHSGTNGASAADEDHIRLVKLTKRYKLDKVVNELSLGMHQRECFGLLGVNGAGKSTTIGMLTRRIDPSAGRAFLCGESLNGTTRSEFYARVPMGVCLQEDSLWDSLTAREHLELFVRMRNAVPEHEVHATVESALTAMVLTRFADRPAGSYSGGNKRKLCVALATLPGNAIVFLDEPSAGMDPVTRRALWSVINRALIDKVVVLTTHSMEEAETVCYRIGIMVKGKLQCLGSPQHLKSKFGSGYRLWTQCPAEKVEELTAFLQQLQPATRLVESLQGRSMYDLGKLRSLAEIFGELQMHKERLQLQSFSLSQTSLEQVFIHFQEKAEAGEEAEK